MTPALPWEGNPPEPRGGRGSEGVTTESQAHHEQ